MAPSRRLTVQDRLALTELAATYVDAVNRHDEAAWSSCWSHDGAWVLPGRVCEGRVAIVDYWRQAMESYDSVVQLFGSATWHGTADAVQGTVYLTEIGTRGETKLMTVGRYDDSIVRQGKSWLFARRAFNVLDVVRLERHG